MERQLPLTLEHRRLMGREDFLVSPCNLEAVEWIDAYPEWHGADGVAVVGERGSGKTHMSWLFSEKSGAKVYSHAEICGQAFSEIVPVGGALAIDDADRIAGNESAEESLLHIVNYARECMTKLFLTSGTPIAQAGFDLDDLRTRLTEFPCANIYVPDDGLLRALLVKQFLERGIALEDDVIEFALSRIERNGMAVRHFVERADEASAAEKRRITIPFAKRILESL
jgi:chromosomal replication initiation ATPase DnaA